MRCGSPARFALFAGALACAGCDNVLQLNLVIYDPCNQQAIGKAQHIQMQISGSDGVTVSETTWSAADGQGEMPNVPPLADAVVSVVGRTSLAGGQPGDAVAGGTVGLVDLSGADGEDLVDVSITIGKVDSFYLTTDTSVPQCSNHLAARQGHTATLLPSGHVLVVGGFRRDASTDRYWNTIELYNPASGIFSAGPNMLWQRAHHTATRLDSGQVLIAGGQGPHDGRIETLGVAYVYEPASGLLAEPVVMVQPGGQPGGGRAYHSATLLGDGTVLLAGGERNGTELQTTEIFDPSSRSFRPGPALNEPRAGHAAVRIGRLTVALIGGRGSGQVLRSTEIVTIGQPTVDGPDLATGRTDPAAYLVPGRDAILVAGGFGGLYAAGEPWKGPGVASLEIIRLNTSNPAQSSVVCTNQVMSEPRGAVGMAPVPGGLLIAGGVGAPIDPVAPERGSNISNSAVIVSVVDVDTCNIRQRETAGDMSAARGGAQLVPLIGGDVLVTGGFAYGSGDAIQSLGSAEVYVVSR